MKRNLVKKLKTQAGLTLIEITVGLLIFASVIIGALALFQVGINTQGSTQLLSDVTAVRGMVKKLYYGKGNYDSTSTNIGAILHNAGKVPSTMTWDATNSKFIHPLDGNMEVMGGSAEFTIKLTGVPKSVCVDLASRKEGWVKIVVDGTEVSGTPDAASTQCSAATNSTNTITFTGK